MGLHKYIVVKFILHQIFIKNNGRFNILIVKYTLLLDSLTKIDKALTFLSFDQICIMLCKFVYLNKSFFVDSYFH